jgi:hypothetical protein
MIISLLMGNFTGNLAFSQNFGSVESLESPVAWGLSKQIPYVAEQENSFVDEGFKAAIAKMTVIICTVRAANNSKL